MTSLDQNKRVLILALSGIGNFLMQSPVFAGIKKAHPNWHITVWVTPRGTKELAENDPNTDAVIEAPSKQSLSDHLKLLHRLRREKFDIAIMLSPGQLIKGALYMFLTGIPVRIAHQYPFRSNSSSSFLLTHSIPEDPSLHDTEQNLALLKLLEIPYPLPPTHYSLSIPSPAIQKGQELYSQLNIPPGKIIIGLHPGSARGFEWKRWPVENFIIVAKTLIEKHNAFILIFGGLDEKEAAQQLATNLKPNAALINTPSLLITTALIQHCKLFISNDSGLMHLAAAAGVTTLGLFGPTNETHTGPRGKASHTLRAPNTQPVYTTEKAPSLGSNPRASLLALKPEQVLSKISELLA